jgi:hypothetical protein
MNSLYRMMIIFALHLMPEMNSYTSLNTKLKEVQIEPITCFFMVVQMFHQRKCHGKQLNK